MKDHADDNDDYKDEDDDDHDDDDDDDDQGTVEGGSRLSVDEGERTPSLLHLVGGLLFVHSNLVFRDNRIRQS